MLGAGLLAFRSAWASSARRTCLPFVLPVLLGAVPGCGGVTPHRPSVSRMLRVTGPSAVTSGRTAAYSATLLTASGASLNKTNAVGWTTSDSAVASASADGVVTAHRAGSVDVRATFEDITASMAVRVADLRLQLVGPTRLTARGETAQLALTAVLADGTRVEVTASARWTSTAPTVATVNPAGVVTAVRSGQADIEATYEGTTAQLTVIVALPPPRLVIDAPDSDPQSLTVTFRWRLLDADPDRTYRYNVRLDKGVNACDNFFEESFGAGTATQLTVSLDPRRYRGASVDFAITAEDEQWFFSCAQGRPFRLP